MFFANAAYLERLIAAYFESINGEFHFENIPSKNNADEITEKKRVWDRLPEPPTLSGLALYLGFDSCESLDNYSATGQYATFIKRALLRIETAYEQKLHNGPASGAIFALKKLGWNQREIPIAENNAACQLNINVTENRIPVAGNEKDVRL